MLREVRLKQYLNHSQIQMVFSSTMEHRSAKDLSLETSQTIPDPFSSGPEMNLNKWTKEQEN